MNMTDIQHQPLQEVEVYRDLGSFDFEEAIKREEEDEKKAEDDDMAEGA